MAKHIHIHLPARTRDAWEEGKHPRAPDGKFGSGSGSSNVAPVISEAGMKSGLSQLGILEGRGTEYKNGQGLGSAQKGEVLLTNVLASEKVDVGMNYSLADQRLPGKPKVEKLALRKLIGTQVSVDADKVRAFLKNEQPTSDLPQVARTPDGKLYLQDGHHRITAMRLAGERETEFEVHDVPGPPKPRKD